MTSSENRPAPRPTVRAGGRHRLLGSGGTAPFPDAQGAPKETATMRRHPSNWPDPEPYGLADTRLDLWPREDNSFILPLELRPRDEEHGQVWMRDTYVNCFVVDGRPVYVATGTSRVPELDRAAPVERRHLRVGVAVPAGAVAAGRHDRHPARRREGEGVVSRVRRREPARTHGRRSMAGVLVRRPVRQARQGLGPGGALLPRHLVHRRVHGRPLPQGRLVHAGERGRGRGPVPARRGQPREALRRPGHRGTGVHRARRLPPHRRQPLHRGRRRVARAAQRPLRQVPGRHGGHRPDDEPPEVPADAVLARALPRRRVRLQARREVLPPPCRVGPDVDQYRRQHAVRLRPTGLRAARSTSTT